MMVHPLSASAVFCRSRVSAYRHYSLAANPFTTTSDYSKFQRDEESRKEAMASVPSAPKHSPDLHIYDNIVKPSDVCDLFFCPNINDVVVTSLAKSCALHGDPMYKVVSRSSVSNSNFVFANIATQWMSDFKEGIVRLSEVPDKKPFLSYNSVSQETQVLELLDDSLTSSAESLAKFFDQLTERNLSIELAVKVLLPRLTSVQYEYLMEHLNAHYHELNHQSLKHFLAVMLEDLSSNATLERVECFEDFFTSKLMSINPKLLDELDPATLAQLAYVTTYSSTLSTSCKALSLLVDVYKMAPPKSVYDLFMSRFRKSAIKENYSRDKILKELSPIKSIMHHYGLSSSSFEFFMNNAVANVRDLSDLVRFAKQTSSNVLQSQKQKIIEKLTSLQKIETKSEALRQLQKVQLDRLISADSL